MGAGESAARIEEIDTSSVDKSLLDAVTNVWKAKYAKKKTIGKSSLAKLLNDPEVQNVCKNPALLSAGAIDHVFYFLDTDNSGSISPQELILGLSALTNGTIKQKAEVLFNSMDLNNDGFLSREELSKSLLKAILTASKIVGKDIEQVAKQGGLPGFAAAIPGKLAADSVKGSLSDAIPQTVNDIFQACDLNNDGLVSKEEWLAQCESNVAIMTLLNVVTRNKELLGSKEASLSQHDPKNKSATASNIAAESPIAGKKI